MYRSIRIARILISLIAIGVPTWALIAGYESVFMRMQIIPALLSGIAVCLIFWALTTLVYGRIYCSAICPLGTLMDCTAYAARGISRRKKSFRYSRPQRTVRTVFLLLGLVSLVSGGALIPTLLDPYSAYARMVEEFFIKPFGIGGASSRFAISTLAAAIVTACAVLAVAWKRGRLLCNTVCPVGIMLGYASRRSYFHIEIDPDRCINCGECERVCKAQCVKLPEKIVDTTRCVVCFNCTAVCPNAAISYKSGRYRLGMPMMQSLDTPSAAGRLDTAIPNKQTMKE